ncbi:MAG TPA: MBL fold metallo-hydrolase [Rhodanobacteraceae bacterium]|nr:MBL fold metallo-hydrolase [Rhodanobacteraceae bacterium]
MRDLHAAMNPGRGILPLFTLLGAITCATACAAPGARTHAQEDHPGCQRITARQCVVLAVVAMGGEKTLAAIHTEQLDMVGHRLLAEQSYQQAPFLTSYTRTRRNVDFERGRVADAIQNLWPESDLGSKRAEATYTIVATPDAAVIHGEKGDRPGPRSSIDEARAALELGPERLLLTAARAPDLHFLPDETLRSTPHAVVAFQSSGGMVKVLLNGWTHLPDALEATRSFDDFWFAWGDVRQRTYFSNWKLVQGVEFPTTRIEERNGEPWRSTQALDVKFNTGHSDTLFAMDPKAAVQSARADRWNIPFSATTHTRLALGIDRYQGSWSVTLIRQADGVLVLEAPISPSFVKGALAKVRAEYPSLPIKGVLTTSDSWPHVAGVREVVAERLPVYALDLNLPILKRMVAAPHTLKPDDLQNHPQPAHWIVVSGKREIGTGPNRVVLYPLRGESTGRQYMVYFPGHQLLYASDTLVLEPGNKLYDPELMHEVMQAVQRNRLDVKSVFAMHQGLVSWSRVADLVAAALQGSSPQ